MNQKIFTHESCQKTGIQLIRCGSCGCIYINQNPPLKGYSDTTYRLHGEETYKLRNWFHVGTNPFVLANRSYSSIRYALLAPFLPEKGEVSLIGPGSELLKGHIGSRKPDLNLFGGEFDVSLNSYSVDSSNKRPASKDELPKHRSENSLFVAINILNQLHDVSGFLDQVLSMLAPEGHLVIEVPDAMSTFSPLQSAYQISMSYFSIPSLYRLLCSAGFEIIDCRQHPGGGALNTSLWAVARKPTSKIKRLPLQTAALEEINTLDSWITRTELERGAGVKKAVKRIAKQYFPNLFWELLAKRESYRIRKDSRIDKFSLFEYAVRDVFGMEAANVRHELYFHSQGASRGVQKMRATVALMRDIYWCLVLPKAMPALESKIFVVSQSRSFSVLDDFLNSQDYPHRVTFIHRPGQSEIARNSGFPLSPSLAGWRQSLQALAKPSSSSNGVDGLENWTVRCCVARHLLWRAVWEKTLQHASKDSILFFHNDFDMYSRSCVEAARSHDLLSVCIQHGLPTDEFFPASADIQLVWGNSSAEVYRSNGVPESSIRIGTSLNIDLYKGMKTDLPTKVLLVSQTHTPVYGKNLGKKLEELAGSLENIVDTGSFEILLHPAEASASHPYVDSNLAKICSNPPHKILSDATETALVVGFSSTALIDAARAGHYVVGLDWPVEASHGAAVIGRPIRRLDSAVDINKLFEQLRADESLRIKWHEDQIKWINETFTPLSSRWIEEETAK